MLSTCQYGVYNPTIDEVEPCGNLCEGSTDMCASHNAFFRKLEKQNLKAQEKRNTLIAKRPNRKRKGNEHLKEIINLYETGMGLRAISRKLQIPLSNVDTIIKTNKHLITRDYVLPSIKQRFESYVFPEPNTGCWIWTGTVNNHGYGTLRHKDDKLGSTLAHRMSYQFHKGEIAKGLLVLHSCDNPYCVNPDHLFLGTHKDNSQDMVSKGRHPNQGKIRPFSKKRIKINKRYFKLVEQFKIDEPLCKANVNEYCTKTTDDPHHRKGRGECLLDVSTWLPVCRSCHSYIEAHPKEAIEKGWSESRLATTEPHKI